MSVPFDTIYSYPPTLQITQQMDETTKCGGGDGGKDRRVAFLDESLDRGKLVYCYALSLCVFVEPRPAYFFTLQQVQICIFFSFCNLFVDLTCGLEVQWKRTLCKHKDFGALCNCVVLHSGGRVYSLFIKPPTSLVPGEGRLMHRNLSPSLTLGHHVTFIMRIVCQTWTGRCHRGCTGAF